MQQFFQKLLRNPQLLLVYLSLIGGALASYFLDLYLVIDMARTGYAGVVLYLETWYGVAGIILFPLFFYSFQFLSRRSFGIVMIISQLAGVAFLLTPRALEHPVSLGLLQALFATAYYQMLHINLAAHSSAEHRGFEMSLAQSLRRIGGVAGALLAGALAMTQLPINPVYMAFGIQLAATLGLIISSPEIISPESGKRAAQGTVHIEGFRHVFKRFPRQNLGTAAEALVEGIMDLLPVWLTVSGMGSLAIGALKGGQALLSVTLVPLVGKIVHRDRGEEFALGSALGVIGWLAMLVGLTKGGIMLSAMAWTAADNFIETGLETRRYSRRSATQIFVREIILTLVRIPMIPLAAWMAFYSTQGYIVIGIVTYIGVGFAGYALSRARHESSET